MNFRKAAIYSCLAAAGIAALWFWSRPPRAHDAPEVQHVSTSRAAQSAHGSSSRPRKGNAHASLTRPELLQRLSQAKPLARGELRNDETIALLTQLAELDPQAAINFANQHPELHGQVDLATVLFAQWLDRDMGAARAWLNTLPAGELRIQMVPMVVSLLASSQPEEALQLANELPGFDGEVDLLPAQGPWNQGDEIEGRVREKAFASIFREWASSDPSAAAKRAIEVDDALLRNLSLQEVATQWILKDADAAIEWLKQTPPGSNQQSMVQGLLSEWTARAPQDAAAYVGAMPESPHRSLWLRELTEGWAARDPHAAMAWAARFPGASDQAQVVRSVLGKVMESGTRNAADMLFALPAGTSRRQAMEMVLSRWNAEDAPGLHQWFDGLPTASRAEAKAALPAE